VLGSKKRYISSLHIVEIENPKYRTMQENRNKFLSYHISTDTEPRETELRIDTERERERERERARERDERTTQTAYQIATEADEFNDNRYTEKTSPPAAHANSKGIIHS